MLVAGGRSPSEVAAAAAVVVGADGRVRRVGPLRQARFKHTMVPWSDGTVLVIGGESVDAGFAQAARNLPNVNVLPAIGANVYDILKHDTLVLTRAAVEKLEARFALPGEAK